MASPSKEEQIIMLILETSPLKHWHFEEICKKANVTRAAANKWLKKYVSQGLLKRIKEKKRFPYYTAGADNKFYYSLKRIYALSQLHKTGLMPNLLSQQKAKTIIIFGSIAKGDWYKDSDIDIFVLGRVSDFNKKIYESRLKKNIELHIFKDKKEIKKVRTGLIKNIINGYLVKGQMQDITEAV